MAATNRAPAAILAAISLWSFGGRAAARELPAFALDDDLRLEHAGDESQQVDGLLAEWDRADGPGCAVGVGRGAGTVFERGYGRANLDYGVPIAPETVFDIGSISKQFTAASILLLAEAGKLSLDDDIRDYLPEIPTYESPITIRNLLHHTSGMRDYLNIMTLAGRSDYDVISDQDIVDMVARQRRLNFAPGAEYLYSNSGYMLAAVIVKRITGESLGEFAAREIFEPLGMANTFFYEDWTKIVPHRAIGYERREDGNFRMVHNFTFAVAGDGQLYTTTGDLLRWTRLLWSGRVGTPGFLAEILAPGVLENGAEIDYALGLEYGDYRGTRTVGHGGSSWGFEAHLVHFPDEDLSVVVLCNVGQARPRKLALEVAAIWLGDRLTPLEPVAEEPPAADEADADPSIPADAPRGAGTLVIAPAEMSKQEVVAAYPGLFWSDELRVAYEIELVSDQLLMRIPGQPSIELVYLEEDTFSASGPLTVHSIWDASFDLRFERDADGAVTRFTVDTGRARGIEFRRCAAGPAERCAAR